MPPNGLLVVDKPRGPTSHDIVARARRHFATRSVGHAGTLDPMATGVLLLLVGEACKLSAYLTLDTKSYLAEIRFGSSTDTLDAEGTVLSEAPIPAGGLERGRVEAALAGERERTAQIPPAVSAISVGGERAHRLARRGSPPELDPRSVRVESLEFASLDAERLLVEVTASKGYYVRALARDLGLALGFPAHLSSLRRTRSGSFSLSEATVWPPDGPVRLLSPLEVARRCLPCAELTAAGARRARAGQLLSCEDFVRPSPGVPCAWVDPDEHLVALGASTPDGFRVLRGFVA